MAYADDVHLLVPPEVAAEVVPRVAALGVSVAGGADPPDAGGAVGDCLSILSESGAQESVWDGFYRGLRFFSAGCIEVE